MRFFAAAKTSLIHYYKTINLELVSWIIPVGLYDTVKKVEKGVL